MGVLKLFDGSNGDIWSVS